MDIVDTFNHLIPSDQLDESLLGQNLECEGSNEFGPGIQLEDSLKNMLSDKDPMFGSASSQFNLLDNEETAFPIAASKGMNIIIIIIVFTGSKKKQPKYTKAHTVTEICTTWDKMFCSILKKTGLN